MKKNTTLLTKEELLIDLTFHSVPATIIEEFAEKIVKPYYKGNLNAAFQDLVKKTIQEQNFVQSHITHLKGVGVYG